MNNSSNDSTNFPKNNVKSNISTILCSSFEYGLGGALLGGTFFDGILLNSGFINSVGKEVSDKTYIALLIAIPVICGLCGVIAGGANGCYRLYSTMPQTTPSVI